MFASRHLRLVVLTVWGASCGYSLSASDQSPEAAAFALAPASQTLATTPSLRWKPISGANRYHIIVARDKDFKSVLIEESSPIARLVPSRELAPGSYWWKVRADKGSFSTAAVFTIMPVEKEFAVPADASSDTIRQIVAEACSQTPSRVKFAANAVYRLDFQGTLLSLADVSNLEIDGNGATLLMQNPLAGLLKMERSTTVTIRNLTIDYQVPPYAVGRVVEVDRTNGSFTLQQEGECLKFDAPVIKSNWSFGNILDAREDGSLKPGSPLLVSIQAAQVKTTSPGHYAVSGVPVNAMKSLEKGDRYLQFCRMPGGRSLFHLENCKEVAFINVTNYATPVCHYVLIDCSDCKVLSCRSLIKPGRAFGGNADGVHARSNTIGPWIENCTFEGIGDDGVALYGKAMVVLSKDAGGELVLDSKLYSLAPGKRFLLFSPAQGTAPGFDLTVDSSVRSVPAKEAASPWAITFTPALNDLSVERDLDPNLQLQAFNQTDVNREFMVRRSRFSKIRRYGVIVRASDGAVEDNEFFKTSDSAITLQNEPLYWRNGLQSENIRIERNKIEQCNFILSARDRGSIHIALHGVKKENGSLKESSTPWRGHRNISIIGNSISQWQQRAISVQSAEGLLLQDNRIERNLPNSLGTSRQSAVFLDNVSEARLAGNVIEGLAPESTDYSLTDCKNLTRDGISVDVTAK